LGSTGHYCWVLSWTDAPIAEGHPDTPVPCAIAGAPLLETVFEIWFEEYPNPGLTLRIVAIYPLTNLPNKYILTPDESIDVLAT
jgi:hypothetical protein